jgi:hypothetical protein
MGQSLRAEEAAPRVGVGQTRCRSDSLFGMDERDSRSFDARTLDEVVQAIRLATGGGWIDAVYDRYLDPAPVRSLET